MRGAIDLDRFGFAERRCFDDQVGIGAAKSERTDAAMRRS